MVISRTIKGKREIENLEIKKYGHHLVDRDTVKISFDEPSVFFVLREKYIL
jgi:hypothetical protein